ncbi:MAG: hypothetical protein K0B81_06545 [Candidatus Cloacimonetes bacterium]|nr:hypothetical protein [Candidatus Cloacimonadota bacterium]
MRKLLFIVVVMIAVWSLNAEENVMQKFMEFNQERTEESMINAINYYHSQLELDPENYQIPLLLSYIHYLELNKYIMFLHDNIDSLALGTKFQFANLLLSLNQYEQSIEIYSIINDDAPQWSCPWRHKGEAYFYADNLKEAEIALRNAIETRIEHYDAYVWLALVQKKMERYTDALETLKIGLSYYGKDIEDPDVELDSLDVKFLLLELYEKNQRIEEYETIRQELLQKAPGDPRWEGVKELGAIH